jgi:hypothetical protein
LAEATKALERRMLCGVGFEAYLRFFAAAALVDFDAGFFLLELAVAPAFFFDLVAVLVLPALVWENRDIGAKAEKAVAIARVKARARRVTGLCFGRRFKDFTVSIEPTL